MLYNFTQWRLNLKLHIQGSKVQNIFRWEENPVSYWKPGFTNKKFKHQN